MGLAVDLSELSARNMGIDLCGGKNNKSQHA